MTLITLTHVHDRNTAVHHDDRCPACLAPGSRLRIRVGITRRVPWNTCRGAGGHPGYGPRAVTSQGLATRVLLVLLLLAALAPAASRTTVLALFALGVLVGALLRPRIGS